MDGGPKSKAFIPRIILTQVERLFEQVESEHDISEFNTGSQTRIFISTDETEIKIKWKYLLGNNS